jgi:hypothetical protein
MKSTLFCLLLCFFHSECRSIDLSVVAHIDYFIIYYESVIILLLNLFIIHHCIGICQKQNSTSSTEIISLTARKSKNEGQLSSLLSNKQLISESLSLFSLVKEFYSIFTIQQSHIIHSISTHEINNLMRNSVISVDLPSSTSLSSSPSLGSLYFSKTLSDNFTLLHFNESYDYPFPYSGYPSLLTSSSLFNDFLSSFQSTVHEWLTICYDNENNNNTQKGSSVNRNTYYEECQTYCHIEFAK